MYCKIKVSLCFPYDKYLLVLYSYVLSYIYFNPYPASEPNLLMKQVFLGLQWFHMANAYRMAFIPYNSHIHLNMAQPCKIFDFQHFLLLTLCTEVSCLKYCSILTRQFLHSL